LVDSPGRVADGSPAFAPRRHRRTTFRPRRHRPNHPRRHRPNQQSSARPRAI